MLNKFKYLKRRYSKVGKKYTEQKKMSLMTNRGQKTNKQVFILLAIIQSLKRFIGSPYLLKKFKKQYDLELDHSC